MIEVRIPKEIRAYQEKWLMGMTTRQLICSFLALLVNVPLYLYLCNVVIEDVAGCIILLTAMPFFLVGFFRHNGMALEKYVTCIALFYIAPQKRKYMSSNFYAWLKSEYEKEEVNLEKQTKATKRKRQINEA